MPTDNSDLSAAFKASKPVRLPPAVQRVKPPDEEPEYSMKATVDPSWQSWLYGPRLR
jgi:hypothetical protein